MTCSIILAVLLSSIAKAQDVPPPPKPAEDSPSLEATMKFIQDKLNGQGAVNYLATIHNSRTNIVDSPSSFSNTMFEANASLASCTLSFGRILGSSDFRREQKIELSLREVEKLAVSSWTEAQNKTSAEAGHPEITHEYAPSIYTLRVQMLEGKGVRIRERSTANKDGRATDYDQSSKTTDLLFREEEMVHRVAKAMLHAVELCGGGSKDPF